MPSINLFQLGCTQVSPVTGAFCLFSFDAQHVDFSFSLKRYSFSVFFRNIRIALHARDRNPHFKWRRQTRKRLTQLKSSRVMSDFRQSCIKGLKYHHGKLVSLCVQTLSPFAWAPFPGSVFLVLTVWLTSYSLSER